MSREKYETLAFLKMKASQAQEEARKFFDTKGPKDKMTQIDLDRLLQLKRAFRDYINRIANYGKGTIVRVWLKDGDGNLIEVFYCNITQEEALELFLGDYYNHGSLKSEIIPTRVYSIKSKK